MAFAEIALGQIKALRQPAAPRIYEIWYTYATGYNPSLNQKVNETLSRNGTLTDADIDYIYATYHFADALHRRDRPRQLASHRRDRPGHGHDRRRGRQRHELRRESLADVTTKLGRATDRDAVRGIVESLVQTTTDMERDNQALEARLKSSKQEITQLQQNLETVRNESLTDPAHHARQPQVFRRGARAPPSPRRAPRASRCR